MGWLRLAVPAAVLALFFAGASPSRARERSCDWGASSIAGHLVNGQFVVTAGPTTTGCVPR